MLLYTYIQYTVNILQNLQYFNLKTSTVVKLGIIPIVKVKPFGHILLRSYFLIGHAKVPSCEWLSWRILLRL